LFIPCAFLVAAGSSHTSQSVSQERNIHPDDSIIILLSPFSPRSCLTGNEELNTQLELLTSTCCSQNSSDELGSNSEEVASLEESSNNTVTHNWLTCRPLIL